MAESHAGAWVECTHLAPEARAALAHLPVTITRVSDQSPLTGVSADLVVTLLQQAVPAWCTSHRILRRPCTCGIKTAVLPAAQRARWRACMARSPFGAESVVDSWPYLGVTITGLTMNDATSATVRHADALRAAQSATWDRALTRASIRVDAMRTAPAPPGRRAALWNTYVASWVTYPAQTCLPGTATIARLRNAFRLAFPTYHWAPSWLPSALGPVFRIRGGPRCPRAAALHAGGSAVPRHGGWGSRQHLAEQTAQWHRVTTWAATKLRDATQPADSDALAIVAVGTTQDRDELRHLLRQHGGALYRGAWKAQYAVQFAAWRQRRSATRRGGPPRGPSGIQ